MSNTISCPPYLGQISLQIHILDFSLRKILSLVFHIQARYHCICTYPKLFITLNIISGDLKRSLGPHI